MRKPENDNNDFVDFDFHVRISFERDFEAAQARFLQTTLHMVEKLCDQLDFPSCVFRQELASVLILSLQRDGHERCAMNCVMRVAKELNSGEGHEMPVTFEPDEITLQ